MAAIARAPAGRGQGHSRTIPAGLGGVDTELEMAGRAPSCQGRFLKVRDGIAGGSRRCPTPGSTARAGNAQGAHTRSSSVLSKVAQLESKIMSRKKQLESQNADPGLKPLEEESSPSSASGCEHGARGKKYLKNYGATRESGTRRDASSEGEEIIQSPKKSVMVKQQLDLESDGEEMTELMENSLGFSSGNGNQKVVVDGKNKTPVPPGRPPLSHKEIAATELPKASSFHNKDSQKSVFSRVNSPVPSPTSRNLSGHTTSSSMKDNTVKIALPKTGYTKQSQESLGSDRSEIKSLDELFSNADDAEDPTSSSSNDFRLNILSLDDLAPDITSEAAELKQRGKDIEMTQESNKYVMVEEDQASPKTTNAVTGVNDEDTEKSVTEAEISEHLSGVSTDPPGHKQDYLDQDERTLNSEYSEDFERSLSTTDRESVSRVSEGHSGEHPSSASSPVGTREQHKQGHRVTVRDTGVQTAEPPFTYCWAKAAPSAVLSPPAPTSYIDPVPIASQVISMDAVEALTTYSPSVLVLHSMCKQHLMLTQQFVENVQHLHSSLVESLEHEKFHYHSLEEAKEYIKNHKSPPLTLEQALEEIQRAQEE
ncbi:uncharacterized protein C19orf44 homolog isoform X3 [Chiroxiphia lanceolata]|uniref:uncharacterized protein C19orf44 homolog isoform X3 n=2 Tax=Chiroxiphia lanceolata TaxID=296741 RepID=UPI0013CE90F8|nr:uncharacterized protein C19orf44 homolog isoform X3 [Chiroxiphia lanceolata]XP_032567771.1 uncharacterized protein C19orf44 homolog isoform X3 [Chiroxiphia lanceolata]